ncbi:MAG: hypothetical protein H0W06_13415 [Chloroflexia bacterium]|nr:hypothetical protein [Chloroflexia bacterium]
MAKNAPAIEAAQYGERDLIAELEELRAEVIRRNPNLTTAQADEIAEELTREAIDQLVEQGKISFKRDR